MDAAVTGTVVVGVDGSPGSRVALGYALEDAARRGARVQVVAAAQLPEYWAMAYGMTAPLPIPDIVAGVRDVVQQTVDEVIASRPGPAARVQVSVDVRAGAPADVLLDAADGADLLVLGHRGLGTFRSAVLGSVGLRCLAHASCPVTIVRSQAERAPSTAPLAAPAAAVPS
jgi:nucleotide-binding universal stress UspA family protein